jgi:hypothetical protein
MPSPRVLANLMATAMPGLDHLERKIVPQRV